MMAVRAPERPRTNRQAAGIATAVAVTITLAVGVGLATSLPGHVPRLVVENRDEFQLNVTAGRVDLGVAERSTRTTFAEVFDQGDTWVIRFSYAGVDAGAVTLDRRDLVRDGWRVVVPEAVAAKLRGAAVSPSP
jgi:hypothetical protein